MDDRKKRKQWTTSTDHDLYNGLKELSAATRIASSKLLDEAIEDLLVKYNLLKKEDKKNP